MVTIVGNIKPEDDFTHPLGPEKILTNRFISIFSIPQKRRGDSFGWVIELMRVTQR